MNYAQAFKQIREETQMSRKDLAEKLGCTPSSLSKIERGIVVPKEHTLIKLAHVTQNPLARIYTLAFDYGDFVVTE